LRSRVGNDQTSLGSVSFINKSTNLLTERQPPSKVDLARDYLISIDKGRSGKVPAANFAKVMRLFGLPLPAQRFEDRGLVDYNDALIELR